MTDPKITRSIAVIYGGPLDGKEVNITKLRHFDIYKDGQITPVMWLYLPAGKIRQRAYKFDSILKADFAKRHFRFKYVYDPGKTV